MHAQSVKIEAGRVHLPRRAEWLDDLPSELPQFPTGDKTTRSIGNFPAAQAGTGFRP
jgi:phage terminase large subunit-like protein